MLKNKLLLLIMSGALIFASCSDSGTDPDPDSDNGDGEETVEPTASVNNPEDGATLDGEITLAIGGESENGFDELRIFIGDEQVETIDSPSLPYEHSLATYEYNNGDYDLKAELDAAEPDTTIEASISVTLENYLLTMKTDKYISDLKDTYDDAYLFISDPDGNVLREMELTAESDGTFNILPPSAIEGQAPSNYSFTIGGKYTNDQGEQQFSLTTDAGLESWSTIQVSPSTPLEGSETTTSELTVTMENFDRDPRRTWFYMEQYPYGVNYIADSHGDPLEYTLNLPETANELFITHHPDWETESNLAPSYIHQENPGDLGSSVNYDVTEDFKQMQSQAVSVPSALNFERYFIWMTIAPDSFDDGDMGVLYGYPFIVGDANGDDSGFGIWKPGSEVLENHSFITYMQGSDDDGNRFRYQTDILNGFPDEFETVETDLQVQNWSLDNFETDASEEADVKFANASSSSGGWTAWIPAARESFTFPKIADSLDQSVTSYNRSDFTFSNLYYHNRLDYDGHSDYLDENYGGVDFGYDGNWTQKIIYNNSSSSKAKTAPSLQQSNDSRMSGGNSYIKMPRTLFPGR